MKDMNRLALCFFLMLCTVNDIWAGQTFRVAGYNVENLFDLERSGTEYEEFVPGGASGWTREMVEIKCGNVARVVVDLNADVLALEEVESRKALLLLQLKLKSKGVDYPYSAMSDTGRLAVGCAVLSKYPVVSKKDLAVDNGYERSILKILLDVHGKPLVVYVNHWASKRSPESERVKSAKVLKRELDGLDTGTDYLVMGDFNSNYDEFQTLVDDKELNDTKGVTGINHILGTVDGGRLVDEKVLRSKGRGSFLYNLWLELTPDQRWSYVFAGRKGALDNMMVPRSLYDGRGIDYKDNSFRRFGPDYLFNGKVLNRWRMSKDGLGREKHLGKGYSDHLPVYADFTLNK